MDGPRAALFAGRPSTPSRDGLAGVGLVAALVGGLMSVLGVCASCAGGPRRSFDGAIYRDGAIAFQVPHAPEEWRPVHVTEGSLAYRDDAHGASILVNARCHRPDEGTPLLALTNHLLMGATARDVGTQETVPFDGREALRRDEIAVRAHEPVG